MPISVIAAAAALLLAACALRAAPQRLSRIGAGAWYVLGVVVGAAVIKAGLHMGGLYANDPLAQTVAHAVKSADARPAVVFLGTSMSRNAIDPEALTAHLDDLGAGVRALSVSMEGASQQERDLHLRQLLRNLNTPPKAVFIEVAYPTDRYPTYVFGVAKLSTRAIKQFGPRGTYWAARGLMDPASGSFVDRAKQVVLLGPHLGLNALNVAALRDARAIDGLEPLAAFDPLTEVHESRPTLEEITHGMAETATPEMDPPAWATAFRQSQVDYLTAQGVEIVGFYMPPAVAPERRAYARAACAALPEHPCIVGDDPALLAQLDGDHWRDDRHLLAHAAALFTAWMAPHVAEALEPKPAGQSSALVGALEP